VEPSRWEGTTMSTMTSVRANGVELTLPTLVVHGRADPFFPVGNGEALADAIPAARLLVLDDMGTALRDAAAGEVTAAMLAL
jgi:pimeloyl-ACP methyl ester carboxylesterase